MLRQITKLRYLTERTYLTKYMPNYRCIRQYLKFIIIGKYCINALNKVAGPTSANMACERLQKLQLGGDINNLPRVLNLPPEISVFGTYYGVPGRQAIGSSRAFISRFQKEDLQKIALKSLTFKLPQVKKRYLKFYYMCI